MSKTQSLKRYQFEAAKKVRVCSIIGLKKAFEGKTAEDEQHYDRRVYYDKDNQTEYYPWMFSKTLEHDSVTGFAKKDDVEKIVEAFKEGTEESLDEITQSSDAQRKLENVMASQSFCLIGDDSSVPTTDAPPAIDSEKAVFEMAEVYSWSLLRDTPFFDIAQFNPNNVHLLTLNGFTSRTYKEGETITGQTLHRGVGKDEEFGPYISQFLYLPYNYGNLAIEQKYKSEPDSEVSATKAGWLEIQNGKGFTPHTQTAGEYVHTPRVLGAKVHNDPLYQFYYQAALIAFQNGIGPSGFSHAKNSDWTSGGGPDVLAAVAHVALGALRVAWHQKYGVNMRIRPEVYAQRIQLAYESTEDFVKSVPGLKNIKDICGNKMGTLLGEIMNNNMNNERYLKLQFPEGSPVHPSLPAGHAVVSGACATILKAMLKTHDENNNKLAWPVQAKHSVSGASLINATNTAGMTIVGELNKLGSNVALGRNAAGVHYRCDGDCGIDLGEQYAISYLVDKAKEYHESKTGLFEGFVLEKYSGETIKITSKGVENL